MDSQKKKEPANIKKIHTYCAQCFSNCPVIAWVKDGRFTKVTPDKEHDFFRPLCPKGHAGPELVNNRQRLTHPLKRTNPKGAKDPGWVRISWKEALDTVAEQMTSIKEKYGAEAFAFSQTNVSSPLWEITSFIRRLANLYGTPNHMTTTHICNWHRDNGSALTYGKPGDSFAAGWPDMTNSKCLLIWGHNPKNTLNAYNRQTNKARRNKAKIIVVDPKKTDIAAKADLWLQVKPGTDGALALGMIHLMLKHNLYDKAFVRDFTNAPLLVREDSGDLLKISDLDPSENQQDMFYVLDAKAQKPVPYKPGEKLSCRVDLRAKVVIELANNEKVECQTVFNFLKKSVAPYTPEYVEQTTNISADKLLEAVHMIVKNSPACWYSFNGVEQNMNATQTNRAICSLYALTGDYDKPGGNTVNSPIPPLAFPFGFEFVTPEMFQKNIALKHHPIGPAGTLLAVPPYLLFKAIEQEDPYKIRGLIVFGANTISASPDSKKAAHALKQLDFHVHIDLFLNPTAELADIVLPAASFWETGRIGYPMAFEHNKWALIWRESVAPCVGQSKDDLWIIFQLAKRLGYSEKFWNNDIDAAFESMLSPLKVTLKDLKDSKNGIVKQGPLDFQKYLKHGFSSMTGKVELFSQHLKNIGQSPLPEWKDPLALFRNSGLDLDNYPFLLINAKLREYCHSQHRSLPSLRKRKPHPFIEINEKKALEMGIYDGDLVLLKTIKDQIILKAKLTKGLASNVVLTQHGWWQSCPELGLKGHDIYSTKGANVNLLYDDKYVDPISGSIHMRGFPCAVKKLAVISD